MSPNKRLAGMVSSLLVMTMNVSADTYPKSCETKEQISTNKTANWYAHAESKTRECCCGDYDGIRLGVRNPDYGEFNNMETTPDGRHFRVQIRPPFPEAGEVQPVWQEVPDGALVKLQDPSVSTPPSVAEVWVVWTTEVDGKRTAYIRCLEPGPLV